MLCRSLLLLFSCSFLLTTSVACTPKQEHQTRLLSTDKQQNEQKSHKKVILLMLDSILARSIDQLAETGQVPALSFLIKHGLYRRDLISSFPTMSVTIEGSLLTGGYADQHKVPGLLWYHTGEKRMITYGDGPRTAWKPGIPEWLQNSLYQLNQVHLSPQVRTIHEELDAEGYKTASINGLLYRGNYTHKLVMPKYVPSQVVAPSVIEVKGPALLGFGSASKVTNAKLPDGPLDALGFNDAYTAQSLIALIKEKKLPDLTIAYFPDMDGEIHKYGPSHLTDLVRVDEQLQLILHSFGTWERALDNHIFVVMGDSGASATNSDSATAIIKLDELLKGLNLQHLGDEWKTTDDVAVAVNGRMSYIYSLSKRAPIEMILERLTQDRRIQLAAWKDGEWIHVMQGGTNLSCSFRQGRTIRDRFGQQWDVQGDLRVLDLQKNEQTGTWDSGLFPDGLRRLSSVFLSHQGDFVVATAAPGAEFHGDGSPNHVGGGNHGGLHREDTLIPLIVAGTGTIPPLPNRVIEMKKYLLRMVHGGS